MYMMVDEAYVFVYDVIMRLPLKATHNSNGSRAAEKN